MRIQALKHQLLHDLKASWQKSALLAGLLLVGLYFWLPPVIRAFSGSSPPPRIEPQASSPAALLTDTSKTETSVSQTLTWKKADEVLRTDPLVQSVEVAAIQSNPFRIDPDQFSPPILFADEPEPQETAEKAPAGPPALPAGIELKSTIVGAKRRAAYINRKLYFEGSDIVGPDGETYRLTEVHPRMVVLEHGGQTFELKIADRFNPSGIDSKTDVTDDRR